MGYDTSFHPVDEGLVRERLLPYVAGRGADDDIDDLIRRAVALRRVRFRAKSWALGAIEGARGLGLDVIDSMLHVWGRPFFITGDDPDQVAADAVRWLATPVEAVDDLAREMLTRLHPALPGAVEPDSGGTLPGEEQLFVSLSWTLRLLRDASRALRAGEPAVGEHDPKTLLQREVPLQVLTFAAALTPGWMSRGYTWPTKLCEWAGGVKDTAFDAPQPLLGAVEQEFPDLWYFLEPTIVENYMVGGYVAPQDVPATRAALLAARPDLLAAAEREAGPSDWLLEVRKIDEALALAERLGHAFCEATEVYSGMEGNLN